MFVYVCATSLPPPPPPTPTVNNTHPGRHIPPDSSNQATQARKQFVTDTRETPSSAQSASNSWRLASVLNS